MGMCGLQTLADSSAPGSQLPWERLEGLATQPGKGRLDLEPQVVFSPAPASTTAKEGRPTKSTVEDKFLQPEPCSWLGAQGAFTTQHWGSALTGLGCASEVGMPAGLYQLASWPGARSDGVGLLWLGQVPVLPAGRVPGPWVGALHFVPAFLIHSCSPGA